MRLTFPSNLYYNGFVRSEDFILAANKIIREEEKMCSKSITIGKGDSISLTGGYTEKVEEALRLVGATVSDDGEIKIIVGSSDMSIPAVKGASAALFAIEKLSYYKSRYAVYAECGVIGIA